MSSLSDARATGGGRPHGLKSEPGKGNGNWQQQGLHQNFKKPILKQPKFEGRCEELKWHIFDCSDGRGADEYTKMAREIAEYAGWTCNYSADIRKAIKTLEETTIAHHIRGGKMLQCDMTLFVVLCKIIVTSFQHFYYKLVTKTRVAQGTILRLLFSINTEMKTTPNNMTKFNLMLCQN